MAMHPPFEFRHGDQHELAGEHDFELRLNLALEVVETDAE